MTRGIERGGIHEGVKGVACVTAGNLGPRKGGLDRLPRGRVSKQVAGQPVEPRFQGVGPGTHRGKLSRRKRAEGGLAAVGEKPTGSDKMVTRRAPGNGVRAAGVVPNHPPDHGPRSGRGLRRKKQPVGCEDAVQVVADHTRLHANAAACGVEGHDPVEVPAHVDDDSAPHHLAGQRCTRPPWHQRHAVGRGKPHKLANIGLVLR